MRSIWFFITSILLLLANGAYAQEVITLDDGETYSDAQLDSIRNAEYELAEVSADTIEYPFVSSVGMVLDYGKLIGLFVDFESKYEFGTHIEFFDKVFITGEYGMATLEPEGAYQNGAYLSAGSYYRVGLGFKAKLNPKNRLYISGRYGASQYSDEVQAAIESPSGLFGSFGSPYLGNDLSADWYEFVLSSDTKIWKGLYLGFHARLRILNEYEEQVPIDTYSIPGYGRTIDKTVPAINLYIKYALDWYRIVDPPATNP